MSEAARLVRPGKPIRASDAPESDPQGPVRTCVGCKEKGSRSVLVRVVLDGNQAVVDESKARPGRGAWLHRNPDCFALAVQRRAIGRALRAPGVDASGVVLN
ncbi:MAG: DUF448 domain-containing protein [Actinobacteria bacterium HGW-Actinobacteria-4]|nr:MAG: DUF448 domain-containing protein [Actinobacteria bacterium HGW-Actinobacteria-4]